MRVAKVATGFLLPMRLENLLECSLIKMMSMTKENMYMGKHNCSNDFQNASIPPKKQTSKLASRLRDTSSEATSKFDVRILLLFLISKMLA